MCVPQANLWFPIEFLLISWNLSKDFPTKISINSILFDQLKHFRFYLNFQLHVSFQNLIWFFYLLNVWFSLTLIGLIRKVSFIQIILFSSLDHRFGLFPSLCFLLVLLILVALLFAGVISTERIEIENFSSRNRPKI